MVSKTGAQIRLSLDCGPMRRIFKQGYPVQSASKRPGVTTLYLFSFANCFFDLTSCNGNKPVLNSGFHAVDSGFQLLGSSLC